MAEIRRRERERGTEARLWKLLRFWSTNLANSLAPARRRGRKLKKWRPCRLSFNKEPVFVTRRCTQVSPNWILLSRATWTIRFSRRGRVGQRHCQLTDLNVAFLFSCLRKMIFRSIFLWSIAPFVAKHGRSDFWSNLFFHVFWSIQVCLIRFIEDRHVRALHNKCAACALSVISSAFFFFFFL